MKPSLPIYVLLFPVYRTINIQYTVEVNLVTRPDSSVLIGSKFEMVVLQFQLEAIPEVFQSSRNMFWTFMHNTVLLAA